MAHLFEVHGTLVSDVAGGDGVEGEAAVVVEDRLDAQLDVFLDAEFGEGHALAHVHFFAAVGIEILAEHRNVEQVGLTEIRLGLLVEFTQTAHLLIEVDETAIAVVERHGDEVGLEDLDVFLAQLAVLALLFNLLGDVLHGVDDIARPAGFALCDGIAV